LLYSELIGEGELDEVNDTWNPIHDANATKLNEMFNGAYIRMLSYIIPLELGAKDVTSFLLVPFVGACIHTPTAPPNQRVIVSIEEPWPSDKLWDPVRVTGVMRAQLQSTELGEIGRALSADEVERSSLDRFALRRSRPILIRDSLFDGSQKSGRL
jgi:hypothetical protein